MSCIRVLILAGKGESTRLMFNGIKDSFSVEKVIIEEPVPKKQLLTQRLERFGLLKVIGQILFMAYNSILLKKICSKSHLSDIFINAKSQFLWCWILQ